jgi:beta-glucanase (GH16 family)
MFINRLRLLLGIICIALSCTAGIARASDDPGGVPMPTGNIPGWTYVKGFDFTTAGTTQLTDNSNWQTYYGEPGGDPGGWWAGTHDIVTGGALHLKGYQDPSSGAPYSDIWTTGGAKLIGYPQTYGKYEVRFKMQNGEGVGPVIMLWPADNSWPPEIDFAENNGSNPRSISYATLHYGSNNTQIGSQTNVDWSQWHTYGIEWTAGQVVFTLDGTPWYTIDNANVPNIPMVLLFQTGDNGSVADGTCQGGFEQCTDSTTPAEVDGVVDWAVEYSPAGNGDGSSFGAL